MSESTPHVHVAARYWDANGENEPTFWMAHSVCRDAINRRVTGSPYEWPLDWFQRVHAPGGFDRGVSWGCGSGSFERAVTRSGLVRQLQAFDVARASLEEAESLTRKEALEGIEYALGDFDDPQIPKTPYDIAFFHSSLHRVSALERLFRRLTFALRARGMVYVDGYVGPSRSDWAPEKLRVAQAVLEMVPPAARIKSVIEPPIQWDDTSEAIRSSEIEGYLHVFFEVLDWRPFGGQIVDLVMPCVSRAWADSDEGHAFVSAMLRIEDDELEKIPRSTHHVVACGRLKSLPRLAVPLAAQALAALRRRFGTSSGGATAGRG